MKKNIFSIILVISFLLLLAVPCIRIDIDSTSSAAENRNLAKFDSLVVNGRLNFSFGKNFENWFNDRFFGRQQLIKLLEKSKINDKTKYGNAKLLYGKDGWYFTKMNNSVENYLNIEYFSDKELAVITTYIDSFYKWCISHGKDFIFVIAPDKMRVYGDKYPDILKKTISDEYSKTQQFIEYFKAHSNAKILYPLNEILSEKSEDNVLYYKTDSHWTEYSGYIAYRLLNEALGSDYSDKAVEIKKWNKSKFEGKGDLSVFAPNGVLHDETLYFFADYDFSFNKEMLPRHNVDGYYNSSCISGNKNLAIYRDSFSINMHKYLSQQFAHVEDYWERKVTSEQLKNIEENCDVVIFEIVERYMPFLAEFTFPSVQ